MKTTSKLWLGLAVLAILSPLGLYLPEKLKAGAAWGEWGTDEIKEMTGFVPVGLEKISSLWNAIFPDYTFKGWESLGMGHLSLAYIFSALTGIVLCVGVSLLLAKLFAIKGK
ncbi:MAG TPA: PDGLE domain-containing protein [Chitinispirillaceae bacterium]|nr:PDGLE domain-containing protein [Chitinispirillaceae bacterium]